MRELGESAISTSELTKAYGARVAVAGIDLDVPRGSAFGFLGPNGAGKTTAIRLLLGLARPTGGTIELLGASSDEERRTALADVGALLEDARFYPHLSGRQNLEVIAAARGAEALERVPGLLDLVGLGDRGEEAVGGYSLGMRQRLGIARCLLGDPRLLILDEPMNGLDPAGIAWLRQMIAAWTGEGRTVFLSSHLLDEVEKVCRRVAIIDHGRIVTQGTIEELTADTATVVVVGCADPTRAVPLVRALPEVADAAVEDGALRVSLATGDDRTAVNALIRVLLAEGIAIDRVVPQETSLEKRYFALTSQEVGTGV